MMVVAKNSELWSRFGDVWRLILDDHMKAGTEAMITAEDNQPALRRC